LFVDSLRFSLGAAVLAVNKDKSSLSKVKDIICHRNLITSRAIITHIPAKLHHFVIGSFSVIVRTNTQTHGTADP